MEKKEKHLLKTVFNSGIINLVLYVALVVIMIILFMIL